MFFSFSGNLSSTLGTKIIPFAASLAASFSKSHILLEPSNSCICLVVRIPLNSLPSLSNISLQVRPVLRSLSSVALPKPFILNNQCAYWFSVISFKSLSPVKKLLLILMPVLAVCKPVAKSLAQMDLLNIL